MDERQDAKRGEINLIDIVFYCLERWRCIVACMLVLAVVAGAYKYQAATKLNQLVKSRESSLEKEEGKNKGGDNKERTVEFYEHAMKETEYDLGIKEDYMNDSIVMQMDPYHVSTGTLTYYVEEGENKTGVLASYRSFVTGGGMAERLFAADGDISAEDLQYLILFTDSFNKEYEIDSSNRVMFGIEGGTSVFQIQIRMPDSEMCESYLKHAEEIMSDYTAQMQSEVGEHRINLLSSVLSEMADEKLQEYQTTIRTAYATSVRTLQALRMELNTVQNGVSTQGEESAAPVQVTVNAKSAAIKFALLGMVLGAAMACFILVIFYLLGGRLQDAEAFHAEFGMPMLGMVRTSGRKKRLFGFIDTWIFQLRGNVCSKVSFEEQIKMAAANMQAAAAQNSVHGNMGKIMVAGTVPEKEAEELYSRLASEVDNVSLSRYMQVLFQSSALKELEDYDGVLFIEKRRYSNCRFIEQEKKLAADRDVAVLGTIVLC